MSAIRGKRRAKSSGREPNDLSLGTLSGSALLEALRGSLKGSGLLEARERDHKRDERAKSKKLAARYR
jgi:hypothetical protein